MTDERRKQIEEQAKHEDSDSYFGFISGAEWADANPCDHFCDGVNKMVPEYLSQIGKLQARIEKLREALAYAWDIIDGEFSSTSFYKEFKEMIKDVLDNDK